MKVVIDFQSCQTESKYRGVGRYSLSLSLDMVPILLSKGHEVSFLCNGLLGDRDEMEFFIKKNFGDAVSIVWFHASGPVKAMALENQWRLRAAEVLREATLISLSPDVVHITSLLPEGWIDDFVVSVGHLPTSAKTVVTHYDLIPLILKEYYLTDPLVEEYFTRKLEWLKKCDLLLCISNYTEKEAQTVLQIESKRTIAISSAVSQDFIGYRMNPTTVESVVDRFNLNNRQFFLYAPGGFDFRKNLNRLIEAYAELPQDVQRAHPLVIASKLGEGQREAWMWKAGDCGVVDGCFILTDYVNDEDLRALYASCHTYVFPSLHEGFGLPVLEAMACGAAVIASNATSIPEVVGDEPDALFDPYDIEDIRRAMLKVAEDSSFHARLKLHSKSRVHAFSWNNTATRAVQGIEDILRQHVKYEEKLPSTEDAISIVDFLAGNKGSEADVLSFIEEYSTVCERMRR